MKFLIIISILLSISLNLYHFTSANESQLSYLLSPEQLNELVLNDLKDIMAESFGFSSSLFSYSTDSCIDKIFQLVISLISNEPLPEG
jgi:hypothetical protein